MCFLKKNPKDCFCERHKINIPTLGWVRLKEKGYLPTTKQGYMIRRGTVSCKAGRYYVSVLVNIPEIEKPQLNNFGSGIDLGVKDFAVISNSISIKLKKLEKQLKIKQRCLSRKYENLKKRNNKMKGEATRQNI